MIRAAAAEVGISPVLPCLRAGYGGGTPAEGQLLPLKVRAVHVRGGAGGIVLVAVDSFSLSPRQCDRIRDEVVSATGIRPEHVLIHSTHVHHAPPVMPLLAHGDWAAPSTGDAQMDRIVSAASEAASVTVVTTRPAETACAALPPPKPEFRAYEDERCPMQILAIRRPGSDGPFAIVLHGPVPPCVMGPDVRALGGDVPAAAEQKIRAVIPGLSLVYLLAPSGDYLSERGIALGIDAVHALAEDWSRRICAALQAIGGDDYSSSGPASGLMESVVGLPLRQLPRMWELKTRLGDAQADLKRAGDGPGTASRRMLESAVESARCNVNIAGALARAASAGLLDEYLSARVQAIRIGRLRIAGLQGMPFADAVPALAAGAGTREPLWVAGNANGDLQGYVPLPKGRRENPPARIPSPFAARGVPAMLDSARRLIGRL